MDPKGNRVFRQEHFILASLLAIGFIGLALMRSGDEAELQQGLYAAVHFQGELAFVVRLDVDDSFTLAEALGLEPDGLPQVHFEVRDGSMAFVESDCPDLLCVAMGHQSRLGGFAACLPNRLLFHIEGAKHSLFSTVYFDMFDTLIFLRFFALEQAEFDRLADAVYDELLRLHMLFDIYNEYYGINNVSTINKMAGISPVTVDKTLLEMVDAGIEAYHQSEGAVNIALGSVLRLWHDFFSGAVDSPPHISLLGEAMLLSNIDDVIVDRELSQVYLTKGGMSLDLGALAKGFALEHVLALADDLGITSGIISMGGDMVLIGSPLDGRDAWTVGIENPMTGGAGLFGTMQLAGTSVATSGNYLRNVVHDGRNYHHIIDPGTLVPADQFISLTIVHPSPFVAEFLTTAAFVLPFESGIGLVESLGAQGLWILPDGSYRHTDDFIFTVVE